LTDPLAATDLNNALGPAEPPDELLDTLVADKYRVLRCIGKGGFGAVYEVRHHELNKRFALKVLLPELSARADVVRRFRNEATAASSIGNEHIVEVIDIGLLPSKAHYLLLEYLEGEDFAHLIEREGPLPLGRTVRIVLQLCEGLAAAHAKNIVHRDLKPENIFLLPRKHPAEFVKILDFGISKFTDGTGDVAGLATATSTILGTPYYMSPEQLQSSKHVDARADLYAVGVILYRALTKEYPFGGESFGQILLEAMTKEIPDVCALRPDISPAFSQVLRKLLAKSRDDRTGSCEQLMVELAPFANDDHVPAPPESNARPPTQAAQVLSQNSTHATQRWFSSFWARAGLASVVGITAVTTARLIGPLLSAHGEENTVIYQGDGADAAVNTPLQANADAGAMPSLAPIHERSRDETDASTPVADTLHNHLNIQSLAQFARRRDAGAPTAARGNEATPSHGSTGSQSAAQNAEPSVLNTIQSLVQPRANTPTQRPVIDPEDLPPSALGGH
jgi:serine/threonine-protein kinase